MIALVSESSNLSVETSSNMIRVTSLASALILSGIDVLVIHSFPETDEEASSILPKFSGVKLYYINNRPSTSIQVIISGLGGKVIDDEYFLEDPEVLHQLVTSSTELVQAGSEIDGDISILDEFIHKIGNNESITSGYAALVKRSTRAITKAYEDAEHTRVALAESAVTLLNKVNETSKAKNQALKEAQDSLGQLKKELSKNQSSTFKQRGGGLSTYPTYSYVGPDKVVVIKDLGFSPFMFSFVTYLREYMVDVYHYRTRLIIVTHNSEIIRARLSGIPLVTSSNTVVDDPVVMTSTPSSTVLKNLLGNRKYDSYIVLDYSSSSPNAIVSSNSPLVYSVSSSYYLSKFKINASKVISVISTIPGSLGTITVLNPYPTDRPNRKQLYFDYFSDLFNTLLKREGIRRK